MTKITVLSTDITVRTRNDEDYISLTDIARHKNAEHTDDLIRNCLRNRNTIEFQGIWEHLNNPDFKPVEFDGFRKQAGLNSFTLTPSPVHPGEPAAIRAAPRTQPDRHSADAPADGRHADQTP